jgi:hypothetical protein
MNFQSALSGPGGLMLILLVVAVAVNVYSYWIYNGVRSLVVQALQSKDGIAGNHTVATYAKLLYSDAMRGRFYTPSQAVSGNRANDRICRQVERSEQYAHLKELASWVRDLPPPFNLVPYCV